jgi:3-oxoacyl-[acyl-carrier-protein] synthase II
MMARPRDDDRRVVVTGLGAITPAGNDVPSTWASLVAGRSAVHRAPRLEAAGCRSRIAAEVRGFDPGALASRQKLARLGHSTRFALCAALEAWHDAGLDRTTLDVARCGSCSAPASVTRPRHSTRLRIT